MQNGGTHATLADRLALAQATLEEGADDFPTRRDEIRDLLTAAKVRILAYTDPEEPRPPVGEFAHAIVGAWDAGWWQGMLGTSSPPATSRACHGRPLLLLWRTGTASLRPSPCP